MTLETLLKLPGFLYEVNGHYYYLGKWICKECTEIEATDCVSMYHMCRNGQEEPDTAMYFQKIRAFSDFALEVPYNPAQIQTDLSHLLTSLTDADQKSLDIDVYKRQDNGMLWIIAKVYMFKFHASFDPFR